MSSENNSNLHLSPGQIAWKRFKRHRLAMVSLWVLLGLGFLSVMVPVTSSHDVEKAEIKKRFLPSGTEHFLGTDESGRDVFTRLFYGGRISLAVGLLSALCAAFIGSVIGSVAGYFGGWIDAVLMRFTDTMLSLPVLPLLIILSQFEFEGIYRIVQIILIIALFSWMNVARLVRGEVLTLKHRDFIDAAKVMGAGHKRILLKHLIPNALTPVIIATTLSLGSVIQYEAVLSFFGLGIPSTTPTWGNMLKNSLEYFVKSPGFVIYPGLLISITVICVNFIGDGLRDALDPRQILAKKG
ncbi:MAG: ABC transporter permease [Spirochaetota bacterium]|nr:ABC transporter permease [Spirochaetota bacterium]